MRHLRSLWLLLLEALYGRPCEWCAARSSSLLIDCEEQSRELLPSGRTQGTLRVKRVRRLCDDCKNKARRTGV